MKKPQLKLQKSCVFFETAQKEMLQTIAIAEYENDKTCEKLEAVKSLAEI